MPARFRTLRQWPLSQKRTRKAAIVLRTSLPAGIPSSRSNATEQRPLAASGVVGDRELEGARLEIVIGDENVEVELAAGKPKD
jgi:hypothetical protein